MIEGRSRFNLVACDYDLSEKSQESEEEKRFSSAVAAV